MYRFLARPKWIVFTLVVAAAAVAMVALSLWQLRRLDERREFNAATSARIDAPAVELDDIPQLTPDEEWTNILVTGIYDDTAQLEPAAGAGGREKLAKPDEDQSLRLPGGLTHEK